MGIDQNAFAGEKPTPPAGPAAMGAAGVRP